MKNLTPQSFTRLIALLLLSAGAMTGALLTLNQHHQSPTANIAIDPAIPALVVVGKRLPSLATAARRHAVATIARTAGL